MQQDNETLRVQKSIGKVRLNGSVVLFIIFNGKNNKQDEWTQKWTKQQLA